LTLPQLAAPPAAASAVERTMAVCSTADALDAVDGVTRDMTALGYSRRQVFAMRLCLEEALVNAVKHGHGHDPSKTVRLRCVASATDVVAEVEDEGPGFDHRCVADPRLPENRERSHGRGLLLMRHFLTSMAYNERGNRVVLHLARVSAAE
jgi:serine/threonine-protein kinase RsbW